MRAVVTGWAASSCRAAVALASRRGAVFFAEMTGW